MKPIPHCTCTECIKAQLHQLESLLEKAEKALESIHTHNIEGSGGTGAEVMNTHWEVCNNRLVHETLVAIKEVRGK